jgi:hypothetical protein
LLLQQKSMVLNSDFIIRMHLIGNIPMHPAMIGNTKTPAAIQIYTEAEIGMIFIRIC